MELRHDKNCSRCIALCNTESYPSTPESSCYHQLFVRICNLPISWSVICAAFVEDNELITLLLTKTANNPKTRSF